ncbi:glycoside hydrolase family 3 C-terminal domain-containing protein [Asticcacaulis sp. SL142]|uniref:glycoside hydrolase family 3 C-terminal domain-containing protein n=1 Tax=Asticcacaulis sp. SL142 TaxID=2995155 RepID=UPI00226D3961|nr:glycoside hydrolase family 3 C-terminal domain-containing protein [Asticcacaulis sp. SL142]WAC46858.1 glycoside hydrolase family 3 C-terminal domain-containing protein [Asticcacaulis sp. SL142]
MADAPPAPLDGPWLNSTLSAEARADAAIAAMTQSEKLLLVFGYYSTNADWMGGGVKRFEPPKDGLPYSAGYVPGVPRLQIPAQWETDAAIGVATQSSPTPRLRTALPSGLATAATWNPDAAFDGGAMIGNEARLSGFNVHLAGGMNLIREPRNGRNFEYSGEDPLLAGVITGNAIKGVQSNRIISTMKHFAFNAQETNRNHIDVKIAEPAARQSDLLAFQIAYEIGNPGSVMCAYNRINGAYSCENDWLLNKVLKEDWGFKGYVMSDWGGTHSTIPAANTGLDQQSGWAFDRSPYFHAALAEAVNNGHVSRSRLDDMARRVLWAMFTNGVVDTPVKGDQSALIDFAAHAKITQAAAEQSLVLLKNDGLLPLSKTAKKIVLIGGHADFGVLSGGGSSQVYATGFQSFEEPLGKAVFYASSPLKAIAARSSAAVSYHDGKDIKAAARAARDADIVIVFGTQWTAEGLDTPDLNLPGNQDALISAVAKANRKTVVVLQTGGPVVMPWLDKVGAILEAWYPGTSGGEAIARVLTGEINPSGRLPVTFPASVAQLPRPKIDGDPKLSELDDPHPHTDYDIEGAAVGYKWFDKKNLQPLFPFGHGLSYTTFSTSSLSAQPAGKTISVSLNVKNTGKYPGRTVTQIYVSPVEDAGWEAPKRLGTFTSTELKVGESKTLSLTVDPRLISTFDPKNNRWSIKGGTYKVMTGDSATRITNTTTVTLDQQTLSVRGQ